MRGAIFAGAVLLLASGWPTESHDVRRTSQSDVRGPRSATNVRSFALTGEQAVNMPLTIAGDGTLFAGTWGMVRAGDKFDGKLFAFNRGLTPRWTSRLDFTPYCYSYGAREPTPSWCPNGGTVNGYNGTVEGVVTIDASRRRLYAGRGDGKLYALDSTTGAVLWRFTSFNPNDRNDPEGGGEVVAGPLVAKDGTIYIATVGVGAYETSAIYAISPDGSPRWRFPSSSASMAQVVWAAPALSPDGATLYIAGGWGPKADHWDTTLAGSIYALNAATGALKWEFHPVNTSAWWQPTVWTTQLAVGANATLYAAGTEYTLGGGSSVLFALRDNGTSASYAWPRMIDIDYDRASIAGGIALRESGGLTQRVYATSGDPFNILMQGYPPGGKLVAVDATSGSLLWTFDPEAHGGTGAMTGIAIDAEGVVYTGVSGATSGGRVYAIREDGSLLWQYALGGLLEWAHPVLGPFGDVYVAETRRCLWMSFPVESGLCNAFDVSPRVYEIRREVIKRHSAGR